MLDRLPALYREEPGILGQVCQVADDLLDEYREGLRRLEDRILREAEVGSWLARPGPQRTGRWGGSGTVESLRRWLLDRHGVAPRVYAGLALVPRDGGWLEIRATSMRCAILAWESAQLPEPPSGFGIEEDLLPVEVNVQAAILRRLPPRRLIPGERVQGVVFWRVSRSRVHQAVYGGSVS